MVDIRNYHYSTVLCVCQGKARDLRGFETDFRDSFRCIGGIYPLRSMGHDRVDFTIPNASHLGGGGTRSVTERASLQKNRNVSKRPPNSVSSIHESSVRPMPANADQAGGETPPLRACGGDRRAILPIFPRFFCFFLRTVQIKLDKIRFQRYNNKDRRVLLWA